MTSLTVDDRGDRVVLSHAGRELAQYVYRPTDVRLESPRPYLSPVHTLGGSLVSLFRPHDHVWHKGIAWSLPVVGDENFWGGPTFVRDEGYVQLANNGEQVHVGFASLDGGDEARIVETLDWVTEAGELVFTEARAIGARVLDDSAWMLTFETRMRNATDRVIPIGSPTTRGRENAGYGGLFWRGPRSFTGGTILSPEGEGGEEMRGSRAPWMGFRGRHDGTDRASTVLMVDAPTNVAHPPEWFARTEQFACLCPAPFFSTEREIAPGETLRERYAVVLADGGLTADAAGALAARVATILGDGGEGAA
ncbi:PmoA family protein [Demequina sp. NBRC 110057]|uniref:DUF6807 domain-containing protein n=1 Tax=Demequina sp. NBRC 110057 TaxID=1570346 RepID=UPI000A06AA33|nr:PmoA family protein [Demequina sp. NBRC 110057]